ncbi:MAG: alpha/beta hydrolase [Methanomicrobiales archaeon]|nr:alpha/beta hydrolase [Methanomicrobiales archaeon]
MKFPIDDVILACRVFGSGEPVVLINGFASAMDTWNPTILAALAGYYRVVIFDNRGTGYSGSSEREYSIPLFAEDTVRLMDVLEISSTHLIGHSMGAMIAQEIALRHPDRVDRMVLVAGDCGGKQAVRMSREVWQTVTDKRGDLQQQAERMFSILFPPEWLRENDPWGACPEVYETTPEENTARQREVLWSWDGTYDRLTAVRSPTLVITGTDDVIIPPENSKILARRIPGARLVQFPDGGHGLMYQFPDVFTDTVLSFLAGRPLPGRSSGALLPGDEHASTRDR